MNTMNISKKNEAVKRAEELAAALARIPETAFAERGTTALIKEEARKYNLKEIELGAETGAAFFLDAGRERTILLRADIDAVPTADGPRHLCGHDFHTASLLGAARYLSDERENLPVNVALVFQPAEESTEGARKLLELGLFNKMPQKPISVWSIHNRPELNRGIIAVHKGALMAEKDEFRVTFTGKTAHMGEPERCIDPILAGAYFASAVASLTSQSVSPLSAAVCKVVSFQSGDENMNPPENAVLLISLRSLSHTVHETLKKKLIGLVRSAAGMFLCKSEIESLLHVPLLDNNEELYDIARRAAIAAAGPENVTDTEPCLGSDDYAFFGKEAPAFYYWVGSGTPGEQNAGWHQDNFRVADGYLDTAVAVLIETVLCS